MKTVLLFGAGADSIFGLSDGMNFAKKVVGINTGKYDRAIREFYKSKKNDWFPNYNGQKFSERDLLIASVKKQILSEDEPFKFKKDFEDELINRVDSLKEKDIEAILEHYPSYMGIIDERFHSIINPKALGPYKFWSVIGCYWRAYFTLAESICGGKEPSWIIMNPDKTYQLMKKKAKEMEKVESYYKSISKNSDKGISVITTNYTPLCEVISGLEEKDIAYIHGSFKWFEYPQYMQVVDVDKIKKAEPYFPYIFIQSGIKPVVDSKQIREYSKAISWLDEDDSQLIIVGYRLNCDDNHINGIIREYLQKGNRVIYLDYKGEMSEESILNRLRIPQGKEYNLERIVIKEDNAIQEFEKLLSNAI